MTMGALRPGKGRTGAPIGLVMRQAQAHGSGQRWDSRAQQHEHDGGVESQEH